MELKPGTPAYKAYNLGVEAFNHGLYEDSCPYILGRVQMLRSWWMVGYHEMDNKKLHKINQGKRMGL
jgi:hypothetical protein